MVAAALLAGCAPAEPDQTTPAGTAAKLVKSEFELYADGYVSCAVGDEDQIRALRAYVDYLLAAQSFRTLLELQRGQDGWDAFAPGAAGVVWQPPDRRDQLDQLNVDVQGDAATAAFPDGLTLHMVRREGLWVVKADDLLPSDRTAHAAARMYTRLAEMLRAKAKKMAREEYSPKALGREVGDEAHRIKRTR